MEIKRKKFQGVWNIISFNRHFYVVGILLLVLLISCSLCFQWPPLFNWCVMATFGYGLLIPLIVSAYVYDFSKFYDLTWLDEMPLSDAPNRLHLNINAGFDETSFCLKHKFPLATLQAYDFYDAQRHTEPAIVRARKVSLTFPNTQQISTAAIPLPTHSVDHIFLLSAIHEIRDHREKIAFLKECKRVCKPQGQVIMVEHLRDMPNFLAFTIGFTHFFSRHTWIDAYQNAGFKSIQERKFTPFMSVFICQE